MPPSAVKSVRQIIYYQYAKIISEASGFSKKDYGIIMNRWKKLCSGEIHWSTSVHEWLKEKEHPNQCIYCGVEGKYLKYLYHLHEAHGTLDIDSVQQPCPPLRTRPQRRQTLGVLH